MLTVLTLALVGVLGTGTIGPDVSEACPSVLAERIPPRPADAPGGSAFMGGIWELEGKERDEAVVRELLRGNVPDFLRRLQPVTMVLDDARYGRHEAVLCVMPDYLALGSDTDFVRVPMGFPAATTVARSFGFTLPTRKMVDTIYQQSGLRLVPRPMKPGPRMVSSEYFVVHNATIERQRTGSGHPLGELVSGHKKDLILTKRLLTRRGRVAIYGWHQRPGEPIQPLSTVHGARYADYSHGVRLVSTTIVYDGVPGPVYDLLRDPDRARVLTHEGTIKDAARIMGLTPPPPRAPARRTTD